VVIQTLNNKGTSKNLLRDPIAALGGARFLAYLSDMSRSLRSGRLALGPLVTVFRGAHKTILALKRAVISSEIFLCSAIP